MEKIDGIADIATDIGNHTCSFTVTKDNINLDAKLSEFAKTNSHLKGYEYIQ